MARPTLFDRPMTPAERMRRYRARKGRPAARRYRGEPLLDLAGLSEWSRCYADVLKRFAIPELLALLRAPEPLGLRTAAAIARDLNGRGQRRLAEIYAAKGKRQALALWRKHRGKPGWLTSRPVESRNPMRWMPLARRRLDAIAPDTPPAPKSGR